MAILLNQAACGGGQWFSAGLRPHELPKIDSSCSDSMPVRLHLDLSKFQKVSRSSWFYMGDNLNFGKLLRPRLESAVRQAGCRLVEGNDPDVPTLRVAPRRLVYGGGHSGLGFVVLTTLGILPGLSYAAVSQPYYLEFTVEADLTGANATTYWTAEWHTQRVVKASGYSSRPIYWSDGGRKRRPTLIGGAMADLLEDTLDQVHADTQAAFRELRSR